VHRPTVMEETIVSRRHFSRHWVILLAACALGAAGCQSSGTTLERAEKAPAQTSQERDPFAASSKPPVASVSLKPVYFEFDRWELGKDARKTLAGNAKSILARPEWDVLTIEGHCDERGSQEYNLALGERRAGAVQRYLVDLGVPSSRFQTVSFGESRPAAPGEDEAAWRLNRRSEFRIELRQASR
jgi:peptidoglycan-associated lipoprotein